MKLRSSIAGAEADQPIQMVLILASIATMTLVLLSPIMTGNDPTLSGEGNILRQVGYILIALVLAVAMRPMKNPRALLTVPMPVGLSLLICAASITWAIEPSIAIRRLVLTALVTWVLCTLSRRMSVTQFTRTIRWSMLVLLVCNYVAVFAFPQTGTHFIDDRVELNLADDWRGIMGHKNFAGAICAITVLFFVFDAERIKSWLRWPVVALSTIFLYYSHSKTSLGVMIAAIVMGALFVHYKSRYRPVLVMLLVVLTAAGAAAGNFYMGAAVKTMQDPTALTGRGFIWRQITKYITDNWMLGAGYGSFWNIGPASPVHLYGKSWVKGITSAHNGYMDLMTQIGVPCTIAVIGLMLLWPLMRILLATNVSGERPALLLALMVFCIGHNMTESTLLDRDSITQVFLVIAIALIWKITSRRVVTGRGTGLRRPRSSRSSRLTGAAA